jgi:hypothetical protein
MRRAARWTSSAAAVLMLAHGVAGTARAGVLIAIEQVGADVVVEAAGTIDTTGLTFHSSFVGFPDIRPSAAGIALGPTDGQSVDSYTGVMGPISFGPGGINFPSSGSGDLFGVSGLDGSIAVPQGYKSGTSLLSNGKYEGQSFSSLGLTPGTYGYSWGTGDHVDTLAVMIGVAAEVPEPPTLALTVGGLALVAVAHALRRRWVGA